MIEHNAIIELFNQVLTIADEQDLLSSDHFSVDSHPPSTPTPTPETAHNESDSFKGQPRSNQTHQSTTDGDARLYCKGDNASKLRYMGHALIENRNGLVVNGMTTIVDSYCERQAAKAMINDAVQAHDYPRPQITVAAHKGYDADSAPNFLQIGIFRFKQLSVVSQRFSE